MHALSGPGRNLARDFWAGPDPAVWRSLLERLPKSTLLVLPEQRRSAQAALPSIRQSRWPTLAVALGDLPDGAWPAACGGDNLGQRQSVGQHPDHLPALAFDCARRRGAAQCNLRAAQPFLLARFVRR